MATVPNGIKIAEIYNRLSRVHERYRQTTDGRATADSERTFAKNQCQEFCYHDGSLILTAVETAELQAVTVSLTLSADVKATNIVSKWSPRDRLYRVPSASHNLHRR